MISFLPGLKSAGGTEEILRNTIGERVLGLPPEPRLDKGIPFSELRAKEREAVRVMNLALSDEQEFLREAARGALSRAKTIEAAREALDGARRCPTCGRPPSRPAGPACWSPRTHGGAGLGAVRRDARRPGVRPRARRRRRCSATCRPRTLLDRGGYARHRASSPPASCARRSCPARPPGDARDRLDRRAAARPARARRRRRCRRRAVTGERRRGCPTRPGADVLVVVGVDGRRARGASRSRAPRSRTAHALRRHPLARPRRRSTAPPATRSTSRPRTLASAWYLGAGADRRRVGRHGRDRRWR